MRFFSCVELWVVVVAYCLDFFGVRLLGVLVCEIGCLLLLYLGVSV